jgi:hypothetical protein
MHEKFSRRIEAALDVSPARASASIPPRGNRQIGHILQQNQRAAARFDVRLEKDGCPVGFRLRVECNAPFDHWAALSEAPISCAPTSSIGAMSSWKGYIQLTQAEAVFRIHSPRTNDCLG